MRRIPPIRFMLQAAAVVALLSFPAWAQYPNYDAPGWRVNGFAGFDLTHTSQSQTNVDTHTNQLFPLGDLRLNSDGFLLDPRFLHINAGLDYQKGTNSSERGDIGLGGTNVALSTSLLPNSHIPLRVTYSRTNHGVTGLGLDQSNDDSRLDVQWNVFMPHLPHITASFQDYSSTVHVPQSFADLNYSERAVAVGLSDTWKNWQWSGSGSAGWGDSSTVSQISANNAFNTATRAGFFNVFRSFWENKAHVRFENHELWRDDHLGGGSSTNKEFTNNATFDIQVHPKVTLMTGYAFTQVDFQNDVPITAVPAQQVQLISLSSSTAHSVSGRVDYRPFTWLRITQDVRDTLMTPLTGAVESQTSFADTASTIEADKRWHGFDLMGSYTGRFQMTGTSLERMPTSWSNSFLGRIGWGDPKYVHLVGSAQDSRLNLVEQIGGFTDEKRVGVEAETRSLRLFKLRSGADYSQIELLNISGNTRNKTLAYFAALDHRRFTVGYTNSYSDGAGALFPLDLLNQQFLVVPLPINQLLATPLLNRTTRSEVVSFRAHPRRRLDLSVSWRTEDTIVAASEQTFNVLQTDARYHIGKFSVEGGYYRNLNDVTIITGSTGTRLAIWYFRIGRDFKVF